MWRYPAAVAIIGATTAFAELLYRSFDTDRLSMVFLAGVLVTAFALGSGPAYLAAALGFVIYNVYLVEPRFAVEFTSPEDVFVLLAFVAVAMLTGGLAGRVRDEARRAQARARTMESLLDASRAFSAAGEAEEIGADLARRIAAAVRGPAAVWDAGRLWLAPEEGAIPLAIADPLIEGRAPPTEALGEWRLRVFLSDPDRPGYAVWREGEGEAVAADHGHLIAVLIDLGAAALSRARLAQAQAETAALARTEQLRAALLSSISHDLRTPLAAILASATSLREFSGRFDEATRQDLALTIEEEAERLNRFVANLLSMTRLEGDALSVQGARFDVQEVIERASRRARPGGAQVRVRREGAPGAVLADPILLEQALGNVLENALRFSPEGEDIDVHVMGLGSAILIEVADRGPGVAADELPRIFEKFYRASNTREDAPGAGLGLSIAKGLVEAMGGSVSARPGAGGRGLVVSLILPGAEGET
jgi:two-component system sensor histidine kinase KdpD